MDLEIHINFDMLNHSRVLNRIHLGSFIELKGTNLTVQTLPQFSFHWYIFKVFCIFYIFLSSVQC